MVMVLSKIEFGGSYPLLIGNQIIVQHLNYHYHVCASLSVYISISFYDSLIITMCLMYMKAVGG